MEIKIDFTFDKSDKVEYGKICNIIAEDMNKNGDYNCIIFGRNFPKSQYTITKYDHNLCYAEEVHHHKLKDFKSYLCNIYSRIIKNVKDPNYIQFVKEPPQAEIIREKESEEKVIGNALDEGAIKSHIINLLEECSICYDCKTKITLNNCVGCNEPICRYCDKANKNDTDYICETCHKEG